jgi:hypothetical protein
VPPEFDGCCGGATPPLFGSTVPPPWVPLLGVCGVEVGGVAVPPVDGTPLLGVPVLGVAPPEEPEPSFDFFFLLSPGCTGSPDVIGGAAGWIVWLASDPPPPPPLEATAITTISKKAIATSATSLRRR